MMMIDHETIFFSIYCQTSNVWGTLVGNKIVDQSDVVVAVPEQM